MDTSSALGDNVHRSEELQPVPDNDGHATKSETVVHRSNAVPEGDLGERWTMDTPTLGIRDLGGEPVDSEKLSEEASDAPISHPEPSLGTALPAWQQEPMPEAVVDWDDFDAGFRAG
jgi:hypothetical protein